KLERQKRRDASKGQNGRSRRKAGVRTFTPWPPLGQKMGEPSAYVPLEKLLPIRILFTEFVICVLIESLTNRFVRRELLPLLSCLLDPCQPRSHVGLVLFVEVAEEEGPGEPLTLKPGQALGIVELLIAQDGDF